MLINSQINRLGVSIRWLASKVGASHPQVSAWLGGNARPRDESMWQKMLEVLRDYDATRHQNPNIAVTKVGIREIIVYPDLTAGAMASSNSDIFTIQIKDTGSPYSIWGRVVSGYSMSPDIMPGDIAVFDDRPWEPYHVVHAFDNGEDTIKVARKRGGKVELVPINPDYDTLDGANANIKGVLVMIIRKTQDSTTTIEYPYGMRYRVTEG